MKTDGMGDLMRVIGGGVESKNVENGNQKNRDYENATLRDGRTIIRKRKKPFDIAKEKRLSAPSFFGL
jgi:hypothetical protein